MDHTLTKKEASHFLLYQAYSFYSKNNFAEAEFYYKQLLKLKKDAPNITAALSETLIRQDKLSEAERLLRKAINKNPTAKLHGNYGVLLRELGKFKSSENQFRKSLKIDKNETSTYYHLAFLGKGKLTEKEISDAEDLLKGSLEPKKERHLRFALGKAYEEFEEFDKSFYHYKIGNDLKSKEVKWSSKNWRNFIEYIKYSTNLDSLNDAVIKNNTEYKNILIIGMPRSGTSLVEQILDSHSKIKGLGERTVLSTLAEYPRAWNPANRDYPEFLKDLESEKLEAIGEEYIQSLEDLYGRSLIYVEKLPSNYLWLAFICSVLPNLKIIHCTRNPKDICFSCYSTLFTDGHEWSYNLSWLGEYYKEYKSLMEFWKNSIPIEIYELNYEKLVQYPDSEIKNLLNFCEVGFEEKCLYSHKNKRVVRTASASQVRSPIYTTSIKRYQNFEKYLVELDESLYKMG